MRALFGSKHKEAPVKAVSRISIKKVEDRPVQSLPGWELGGFRLHCNRFTESHDILDIVRCSVECADEDELLVVREKCYSNFIVLREKNLFHSSVNPLDSHGYRDIKLNCLFGEKGGDGGGTVVEIQLILSSYLELKKQQHLLYSCLRGDFD
jgi:hypothetical protein